MARQVSTARRAVISFKVSCRSLSPESERR
jgi:hypothetical protein